MVDKKHLEKLYVEDGLSFVEIGSCLNVSNVTAKRLIVNAGIPIRSHSENQILQNKRKSHGQNRIFSDEYKQKLSIAKKKDENKPSKEELILMYDKPMSIPDLSLHYNVGVKVIRRWFEEYDIKKRIGGQTTALKANRKAYHDVVKPNRKELIDLYNTMNIYDIAKKFGVAKEIASQWFDELEIEKSKRVSSTEQLLYEFVKSYCIDAEQQNNTEISPYELDIYVPSKKLAIEYCGVYWHSSKFKSSSYHRNKYLACKEKGIDLITVFEYDDLEKIKLLILKKLNLTPKIYARSCTIDQISNKECKMFNETFHLQNHVNANISYGLFYENKLVQIMSFVRSRYDKSVEWEIARLTSGDILVIGGASKLFKRFILDNNPKDVITYADLRFGNGQVYNHLNMKKELETSSSYQYIVRGRLESRIQYQKYKLRDKLSIFDETLTEEENMIMNGFYRIYNCGQAKYRWNNNI